MTETDANGIRVKPDHDGIATPPMGEKVWILKRHDDKIAVGPWDSRHEAVGARARHIRQGTTAKAEWWEPVRVRIGSIRMGDTVTLE